jgi:hypothetical protein
MPSLVPGIHVSTWQSDVDGRDKLGHERLD